MALNDKKKKEYSRSELEVLDGVIDYAERMIFEQDKRNEYGPLRRHAYGKTVVIETEHKGTLTFRLSSTSAVYPKFASGYATPHSPVGRLCGFLRPGDEEESPAWGGYRVLETRLFDRFDGEHFEDNVRNFLRMKVEGDAGIGQVTDLRRLVFPMVPLATPPVPAPEPQADVAAIEVIPPAAPMPPPAMLIAHLMVDEDDPATQSIELDDIDDSTEVEPDRAEEYFGLNEVFYVNRTREQDAIISRSPLGPMFVQGVAGSGKTSAALGRAKMLCDFNVNSVTDEVEFRDIAGQKLDYWSGKYAGQFSQEGSIGFVRTGELIQYLKETCRRIDLPHLPVNEYKDLQSRLRAHRRIERSRRNGASRWAGLPAPRGTQLDTTMVWLRAADRELGKYFADLLGKALPDAAELAARYIDQHRPRALRVANVLLAQFRQEINEIAVGLRISDDARRFALDGLASKLHRSIQRVRERTLGRDVLWFLTESITFFATNENAIAAQLVANQIPLYLKSGARLVYLGDAGPLDASLTLLSESGEPLTWNEDTQALLIERKVLVREEGGLIIRAERADQNAVHLRLLPEAIDKLYTLRNGKLRLVTLRRGLGRERLELIVEEPVEPDSELEDVPGSFGGEGSDGPENQTAVIRKHKSIDAMISQILRRSLLQPLAYLADAYLSTLGSPESYPKASLATEIANQLNGNKLAEEDIDLLLCVAHLLGRGSSRAPAHLQDPPFYQAVFIDEVQDFTEQQVYLMGEQARPEYRAVTVVGDLAQKLHHGVEIDIPACFPGAKVPEVKLSENLRQMEVPALAWFSHCFRQILHAQAEVSRPEGELLSRLTMSTNLQRPVLKDGLLQQQADDAIIETLRNIPHGQTAAVILPNAAMAKAYHQRLQPIIASHLVDAELSEKVDLARRHLKHFTSIANVKGLEFDVVILPAIETYDLSQPQDVNRLYVGITRPRRRLCVLSVKKYQKELQRVIEGFEHSLVEVGVGRVQ